MRSSSSTWPAALALAAFLAGPAACGSGDGASTPEEGPPPGPRLLVVNKSSNTLSVIDAGSREELGAATVGLAPHEVAVRDGDGLAYVTDYGTGERPGSTVSVVDVRQMTRVRTLDLGPHTRPHGIAAAPDGTLWVTTEGSRHVLRVDPASGEILRAVETGQEVTHMVVVAPAVNRVVTANIGSGTVTIVDPAAGSVVAHVETGAGAEGIDLHPDGRSVLVTNREAGTLTEVDLETNRVVRSLEVGSFPIRVRVRPGGGEALVSNARGNEIAAVDLEAWRVDRRLAVGAVPVGILITPDDRRAYVANTQDDRITLVDLETWVLAGDVVAGDEPDGMAWVP